MSKAPYGFWRFALASDWRAIQAVLAGYRRPVPIIILLVAAGVGIVVQAALSGGWSSVPTTIVVAAAGAASGLLILLFWHAIVSPAAMYADLHRRTHVLDDLEFQASSLYAVPVRLLKHGKGEPDGYLIQLPSSRIVNRSSRPVSLSFVFHYRSTENRNSMSVPEEDFKSHELKQATGALHSGLELAPEKAALGDFRFMVERQFTDDVFGQDCLTASKLHRAETYLEVQELLSNTVRLFRIPTDRPPPTDLPPRLAQKARRVQERH